MTVNPSTEQRLRAAMKRLVEGSAQHTDGAYTVSNLAREAQVSRATANRALDILSEFRSTQPGPADIHGQGTSPQEEDNESELRKRVRTLTAEITRIQEEKEALAVATLALFEENRLLNERLTADRPNGIRPIESARSDRPLGSQR